MNSTPSSTGVQQLLDRGVIIRAPASVDIDDSVDPTRIAPGVVIHAGCRLAGKHTSIGSESEIGAEAPATIHDSQLGARVQLKGGTFSGSTFLDGVTMGSGAHVRPGTLLEEESGGAHNVAFKETIFFPYVIAGSLINLCDVLMSGGTSRKDHSEIGSSYIHFNYTPHQDKATASLIGDVPNGVMLNQRPIFLGGQGGLVGPVHIGFGSVIPAGVIYRHDAPEGGMLLYPPVEMPKKSRPYRTEVYGEIDRIVHNNLLYLANLHALRAWYRSVRSRFMTGVYHKACFDGAVRQMDGAVAERCKRLAELAVRVGASVEILRGDRRESHARALAQQERFVEDWPLLETVVARPAAEHVGRKDHDVLIAELGGLKGETDYLKAIKRLSPNARRAGTVWLQATVDSLMASWQGVRGSGGGWERGSVGSVGA
ncbi:MAG: hypothetical protein V1929_04040 [bacterium]